MENFRSDTLDRTAAAVASTYRSDAEPYVGLWAKRGPVSLFGALGPCETGRDAVAAALHGVAARFGEAAMSVEHEVVEVGTDLAFTVGYERGVLAIDGESRATCIRVTHIYRREDDEWRLVHRHGDFSPADNTARASTEPTGDGSC